MSCRESPEPSSDEASGWQRYRSWLHLLAQLQIDSLFQGKFDASDVVQQTLLEAHRGEGAFRGRTHEERKAWLRRILARGLNRQWRRYGKTQARQVHREMPLEAMLEAKSQRLDAVLADSSPSPSQQAANHEQSLLLAEALARLPDDYREVIRLRNLQDLSHDEVARQMGRSPAAVRMLWLRALAALQAEMRRQDAKGD